MKGDRSRQNGAFVYTGSGKKQSPSAAAEQKECIKQAVAIQYCLAKRNHKQIYCKAAIEDWQQCCDKVRDRVKKTGE